MHSCRKRVGNFRRQGSWSFFFLFLKKNIKNIQKTFHKLLPHSYYCYLVLLKCYRILLSFTSSRTKCTKSRAPPPPAGVKAPSSLHLFKSTQ